MATKPAGQHGYADLLRAIGQIFDTERAQEVEIIAGDQAMTLSWHSLRGSEQWRVMREIDLERLRARARELRGGSDLPAQGGHAELLRTLGQELDREPFELAGIVEDPHGYRVTGTIDRRYITRVYTRDYLSQSSERRRARRAPLSEARPPWWAFWRR